MQSGWLCRCTGENKIHTAIWFRSSHGTSFLQTLRMPIGEFRSSHINLSSLEVYPVMTQII